MRQFQRRGLFAIVRDERPGDHTFAQQREVVPDQHRSRGEESGAELSRPVGVAPDHDDGRPGVHSTPFDNHFH